MWRFELKEPGHGWREVAANYYQAIDKAMRISPHRYAGYAIRKIAI